MRGAEGKATFGNAEGHFLCSGMPPGEGPGVPLFLSTILKMRKHIRHLSRAAYNPLDLMQTNVEEAASPVDAGVSREVAAMVMVFAVFVALVVTFH